MKDLLIQTAKRTGLVDAGQLQKFLEKNDTGERLDDALLHCPYFTEEAVLRLFAAALDQEFIPEIQAKAVPAEFVEAVPATYAQHHYLIGLRPETDDGELTVVLSKPLDTNALDNVSKMTGVPVRPAISTRTAITAAIDVAYEQRTTVIEEVVEELDSQQNLDQLVDEVAASDDLLDVVNRPPVIRLVNDILFRALQLRASDIHVHPYETKIQIRYRVDGILYDVLSLNRNVLSLIVSRIKVMAGMDIAERRMPQDGRCSVRLGQREIDLRISTVPTSYGERSVLRLLDKSTGLLTLDELGLWKDDLKRFDSLLGRSHGVIFVTGPTGSGKSTTLYASLNRINSAEKNVMTIEDPIEYQLEGISQMQVSAKKGMNFANSLRHVLRQDPDVIMVGEVRDIETARMAIQSSLTGHLVFSTLHTNDSAGAVTRLLDLGVEPYLVSSSLIAIMAQRLVRKVCPDCRQQHEPSARELRELGLLSTGMQSFGSDETEGKFFVGTGCDKCFQTGYRGRTGIYELMLITEEIQNLIYRRESAGVIKKAALEAGLQTLRMDGARKVLAGATTIAEVLRVTQADLM